MTQLLQQAMAKIQELPIPDQDAIASLILEELADDQRWAESFSRSQNRLAEMAIKVREDIRAGRVRSLGIDEL